VRFEELRLIAYGPFTDCSLQLRPGLNILYGPNEAGKSSALRAVHALLFGVDERCSDDFVHSYPQLRVGGVLVDTQGQRLECVRRKGRKATLRDGDDDQPTDEGLLRDLLGGVDEEFFTSAFGIDHVRLREGGKEVVHGKGRVGELLFAAGGVAHLRDKQQALEEEASALFKRAGQKPRINQAVSLLKQLDGEIRELQRSPEEWAKHFAEHKRLDELAKKQSAELEQADSTRSRLSRIHSALGLLATWKAKRSELASLAEVISLASDAEIRFRQANEKRTLAEATRTKAEERITKFQQQFEEIETPASLFQEAHRIDELYRRLGSHEKAINDRPGLVGQKKTARDGSKRTIQKLGWSLSPEEAVEKRVADDKKARVRALSSRSGEVRQAFERQQKSLDRLREQAAELEKQVANEPQVKEPQSLKDALAAALPAIDAEDRLPDLREEVRRLERETETMLARLPQWDGTLEELCRLKVPTIENIEQFDETGKGIRADVENLAERTESIQADLGQRREELAVLELADSVPTEEELHASRDVRNLGLRLAVQSLRGESVAQEEVDEFVKNVAEGSEIAANLEPSVRRADAIVDRLRREADRVAEKSQLLGQLQSLEAKDLQVATDSAEAKQSQDVWSSDWANCWRESGVFPSKPAEMRAWLRNYTELVDLANKFAVATESQNREEQRCKAVRRSLTAELSRSGVELPDEANLRQLMQLCQRYVNEAEEACRSRNQLEENLKRVKGDLKQAQSEVGSAKGELKQWRTDWAEAIEPLKLSPGALPEQAESVLSNLDELYRNLDQADNFGRRIWGIDETAKEFSQAARELALEVAPDLAEQPVEEIASGLHLKLSEARQVAKRKEALNERLEDEKQTLDETEQSVVESHAIVEALIQQACCKSLDELPSAIEKSQRKQRLEADVEELQSQLTPFCAGRSLEKLLAEAEREDADRLPTRLEELESHIASLRDQRDKTIEGKQREASKLEQYTGDAAAADKAAERQFVLTQLEEDAREYVVTMIASRLLQRAVERYQEKAQGPVLSGASEHFRRLTCEAFGGVRADYDESGQEVLVGVRPNGNTLRVEKMSEGTRDQLYFALRLGTIDHWFDRHDPIPFIVDDVLLAFDDARATAAIETLIALSHRTQVLFFTHHKHLVSLVRNSVGAAEAVGPGEASERVHVLADWRSDKQEHKTSKPLLP